MKTLPAENDPWHKFRVALVEAIKGISEPYFSIPRITGDTTLSERPYCYELYHQLRCRLGDEYEYTLHGELDKRHHQVIREIFGEAVPDFVVHMPGTMNNLVVIEVKNSTWSCRDIQNDIAKLERLCRDAEFAHGVMLVFGPCHRWSQNLGVTDGTVSVLWHKQPSSTPEALNNKSEWGLPCDTGYLSALSAASQSSECE